MVSRINLLLKAKNITARQFAEEIGIQPSGMSHILSGRNNPSLDFVMKVIRRYPEIDINWLMFGKGEMYDVVHSKTTERITAEGRQSDMFAEAQKTSDIITPSASSEPTSPSVRTTRSVPVSTVEPTDSHSAPKVQPLQVSNNLFAQVDESRMDEPVPGQQHVQANLAPISASSSEDKAATTSQESVLTKKKSVDNSGNENKTPLVAPKTSAVGPQTDGKADNGNAQLDTMSVGESQSGTAQVKVSRKLVKILAFYDDNTFVEYLPQK